MSSAPTGRPRVVVRISIVAAAAMVAAGIAASGTWETVGYLENSRYGHTSTLLPSGEVIVVAGAADYSDLSSTEIYNPIDGTMRSGESLLTPRRHHTAAMLRDGRILVCGGWSSPADGALSSCELYDPTTEQWGSTTSMQWPRAWHTATLLDDGSVLVAGGHSGSGIILPGEVFNPQTLEWTATGNMMYFRHHHTATLLANGEVILIGGSNAAGDPSVRDISPLTGVEIYNPGSRSFRTTSSLSPGRQNHSATLLPDGRVVVAGGWDGSHITKSCQLYDATGYSWSTISDLRTWREQHSAVLLANGEVLVVGGRTYRIYDTDVTCENSSEVYNPLAGTWTSTANASMRGGGRVTATMLTDGTVLVVGGECFGWSYPLAQRYNHDQRAWYSASAPFFDDYLQRHTATLLPNGRMLVAGGYMGIDDWSTASCWLWDQGMGLWIGTAAMGQVRDGHTASLLRDGLVLVAGGRDSGASLTLNGAELYHPGTGSWSPTAAMSYPRRSHVAVIVPDGRVLVAGGGPLEAEIYSYDPVSETGSWSSGGIMSESRYGAAATILGDGRVLIAGGSGPKASAEIFDPLTGTWSSVADMNTPRVGASATLLRDGTVLVTSGEADEWLRSCELYDPSSNSWLRTGSLKEVHREGHTATLMTDGRVLLVGGTLIGGVTITSVAEIWDPATWEWTIDPEYNVPSSVYYRFHTATLHPYGSVLLVGGYERSSLLTTQYRCYLHPGVPFTRRPVIDVAATDDVIVPGEPFVVSGTNFFGDSEASQGDTQNSATNYPAVMLRAVDSGKIDTLRNAVGSLAGAQATLTFQQVPADLDVGWYLLTVAEAGVSSRAAMVRADCGQPSVTGQPQSQLVSAGGTASLAVTADAGRWFQWQSCDGGVVCSNDALWDDIAGATGSTYTTDAIPAALSGRRFRAKIYGSCYDPLLPCAAQPDSCQVSGAATVTVEDDTKPVVDVLTPDGGEFWLLSDKGEDGVGGTPDDPPPNTELVTWSMSDDVRVCWAYVKLEYSNDGGSSWIAAPTGGGLPVVFGPGGTCVHPGVITTSATYTVPQDPPSGTSGSLYRTRVDAADHAGNIVIEYSDRPFFIVQANPEIKKTLILADVVRMQDGSVMEADAISGADATALSTKLYELAGHPRVLGVVVDLSVVSSLQSLLGQWDDGVVGANDVLFAAGGLHDYLLDELLPVYSSTEYVVLVGDDRVIPFARLVDGGVLHTESMYLVEGSLTGGSTVGEALAADRYLSDDPLAVKDRARPGDLLDSVFVPDLAVGRLVETPEEITTAIATFISQDGFLDLANRDPDDDHRMLVTGYDFLLDSGRKIRERWKNRLGVSTGDLSVAPVNGALLSVDWGEGSVVERQDALENHLGGLGGLHYGVASLNGHASHFEEGVPGADAHDIQGLSAQRIDGLEFSGSVVYAVGCHGGLVVPGSDPGGPDHSLDLAQVFLGRGAVAYLANTGYGWGLRHGVGYSERLMEIFTEELTKGGAVVVGDAVRDAKRRYVLEAPTLDDYDAKSLMQWTLYGLPMYTVSTGIATGKSVASLVEAAAGEDPGPVKVSEVKSSAEKTLPSHLTRLDLQFDLSAPGLYTKYDADGGVVVSPGCGHPDGCYYTLNGLVQRSTGGADVPLQPMLLYDSRLAGTSQHGVLWKGGSYHQEAGWKPVIGELVSNGGDGSNHGDTPRKAIIRPKGTRVIGGEDPDNCRPSDLELNGLVLGAGEAVKASGADLDYTVERLYQDIGLEVFYYNDTTSPTNNCDRTGPLLGAGPYGGGYHVLDDGIVSWEVPASDDAGVWRVVVVATDNTVDAGGVGSWSPIELEDLDGDGEWTGSLDMTGVARLTYVVQAVDERGNITWLDFVSAQPPSSGVDPGLPLPVDVVQSDIFSDNFESGDTSRWSRTIQ